MATFKQRGSGLWQAVIRRKGHPQQSKTFTSKTDAERWARAIEADMDKGAFVSSARAENTTFAELARRFATEFAPYHYRSDSWQFSLQQLVKRLGAYSLVAMTPPVLCWYRDSRLKDKNPSYSKTKTAPTVSGACVKKELDLLSKVLDVCIKEFGIPLPGGNPVLGIRKPKDNKPRARRLSEDEWEALIRECKASRNPWLEKAVVVSVETAMRQGELVQIEWEHLDKARSLVMLVDADHIKNGEPRAVPLSSVALATIESLPRPIKGGRVFPVSADTLYQAFKHACNRAGIENYRWHDLRHEAISRIAGRGDFTTLELAGVSGHKTLQQLKRYTHLHAEVLARKLG